MHVVSHPEADQELEGGALWYEQRHPGLGSDFLDEFERTLRRIVAEPERWRELRGNDRKLNFLRFPYAIVYRVAGDVLYIKAVMHLHRRPFYWHHRLNVFSLAAAARSAAIPLHSVATGHRADFSHRPDCLWITCEQRAITLL
jgi:toxin ParE2